MWLDRRKRVLRLLAATLAALCISLPARASDISKLDIYGVRLGMNGAQTIHALRAQFGDKVPIKYVMGRAVYFHDGDILERIYLHHGNYDLRVLFTEASAGTQPQPEQVSEVTLRTKGYVFDGGDSLSQQAAVEQEFIDAVLKKYGQPDMFVGCSQIGCPNLQPGSPMWCAKQDAFHHCDFQRQMHEGSDIVLDDTEKAETHTFNRSDIKYFGLTLSNPTAQSDLEYHYANRHMPDQHLQSAPF